MAIHDGVSPRLLGPVQVIVDGRSVALGGPKQRAFLAALVLGGGRPVSVDRLCRALWGDEPPSSSAANLRTYAAALRRLGLRLVSQRPGYRLEVDHCDLTEFERLLTTAAETGDPVVVAQRLGEALDLWQGDALDGIPDESALHAEAARLNELRRAAVEDHVQARLELGEHAALIPELLGLVREFPLRERLWEQLVVAQYRSGRHAEALDTYAQVSDVLSTQLGVSPGPRLRQLHETLLRNDFVLDVRPVDLRSAVDPLDLAVAQRSLGRKAAEEGRIDEALALFDHSLATFLSEGCPGEAGYVLAYRSTWLNEAGRCSEALADATRALDLMTAADDRYGSVLARRRIGTSLVYLERYDEATSCLAEALRMSGELGDQALQADVWSAIGGTQLGLGAFTSAAEAFERSGMLFRAVGQLPGQAYAMLNTARCLWELDMLYDALELLDRATVIFAECRDRRGQAFCALWLGKVRASLGGHRQALRDLHFARHLFHGFGMRRIEAEALCELVPVLRALGRNVAARTAAEQAFGLLTALDDPTVARAAALLAGLRSAG
ncbi:hypothetical protein Lesp02_29700 [Lentzea sp. NBRC 105346]|uniref:BTAD domain-containing putative transcriptional regulator n=1 Tax=Lentzea sp. NBRC 105346 TaxID=3032205 RepID=UPI0024A321D6|nr:BTAD domain-containing putative transcriptional regulator [Lentzea sp. NBRC 105346]GLZ30781.1 hypothetical protein Lesp02_29700 [Lentzea sp. NBRC 105346]